MKSKSPVGRSIFSNNIITWLCLLIMGAATGVLPTRAAETGASGAETKSPIAAPVADPSVAAQLSALEQQPTIPADTLPNHSPGSYYSAQNLSWPPMPGNVLNLPLWSLGGNLYVLDDLSVNYSDYIVAPKAEVVTEKNGGFSPKISGGAAMPYLTISPTGTNQLLLTVINTNPATYYLQTTPALANPNYPWTIITNGTANQTNFIVNIGPYADSFFRVFMATNNPGQGVIAVFIDSPANGATVQ